MKNNKIVIARLWSRYTGSIPSRTPIILGIDPEKYKTICIYLKKSSESANFFEDKGFKVFYISNNKFFRIFNFAAIWKLAKILRDEKVDILHCHRHQSTVYGTIAAMIAGCQVVLGHVHGLNRSKAPRRRFINSLILRRIDRILAVGESVKEDILKRNPFVNPQKIVSLGNSIDYRRFMDIEISKPEAKKRIGLDPDSIVFGTIGRFAPTKGHSYLIDAFAKVKSQVSKVQLVFVGDGRLMDDIQLKVQQAGLDNCVYFVGRRDDVPQILRAMDVFVLPSIAEGLPRVLLEAMAAGVLCIGTNVGGVPDILNGGEFGFLALSQDSDALVKCMLESISLSEQQRNEIIEKSQQRIIDEYSHDVVRKKLENIYKEVILI